MRNSLPTWIATSIATLLGIPATYALLRTYEVVWKSEPNPATIVWTPHVGMFWRLAVSGYVAGMVGTLANLAAERDALRTLRVLSTGVFVIGAAVGIQGLLMP